MGRPRIISKSITATGWTPEESARTAYQDALKQAELKSVSRIIATGYGRVTVPFAHKTYTEITAHARGVSVLLPEARTLIDIGGQDSKAIILGEGGLVTDFAMNDRCAAGSGKFLEFLSSTMNTTIEGFAELAYSSNNPTMISSICTVFAETEVLSLLAEGVKREDAAAGGTQVDSDKGSAVSPVNPSARTGSIFRRSSPQPLPCQGIVRSAGNGDPCSGDPGIRRSIRSSRNSA